MQKRKRLRVVLADAPSTSKAADKGLLILRFGLGFFFIYHGIGKFFGYAPEGGIEVFAAILAAAGFPASFFWAYLVAFIELFGGITIVLGFFTRAFSFFLAVTSLVAFVVIDHSTLGLTLGDVYVLSFTMSLALLISGPGKISFAERWYQEDFGYSEEPKILALRAETVKTETKIETRTDFSSSKQEKEK